MTAGIGGPGTYGVNGAPFPVVVGDRGDEVISDICITVGGHGGHGPVGAAPQLGDQLNGLRVRPVARSFWTSTGRPPRGRPCSLRTE